MLYIREYTLSVKCQSSYIVIWRLDAINQSIKFSEDIIATVIFLIFEFVMLKPKKNKGFVDRL